MKQGIRETVFTGGMLGDAALGSGSGHALAQQLAAAINTPNSTVYDKAIDSVYLSTHTGGSQLHHLVDGQHDIFGAFEAAPGSPAVTSQRSRSPGCGWMSS